LLARFTHNYQLLTGYNKRLLHNTPRPPPAFTRFKVRSALKAYFTRLLHELPLQETTFKPTFSDDKRARDYLKRKVEQYHLEADRIQRRHGNLTEVCVLNAYEDEYAAALKDPASYIRRSLQYMASKGATARLEKDSSLRTSGDAVVCKTLPRYSSGHPVHFEQTTISKVFKASDVFAQLRFKERLEEGSGGYFVGTIPRTRAPNRPQVFSLPYTDVELMEEFDPLAPACDGITECVMGGSWDSNFSVVQTALDSPLATDFHLQDFCQIVQEFGDELQLRHIGFPSCGDTAETHLNPSAYPGVYSSVMLSNKLEAYPITSLQSRELFRRISEEGPQLDPTVWAAMGRSKRNAKPWGERLKSRLVQAPEDFWARYVGVFAEPITTQFVETAGVVLLGEPAVGGSLAQRMQQIRTDKVLELDWGNFDSTVRFQMKRAALALAWCCYAPNTISDNHLVSVASSILSYNLLTPEGGIWHINNGVPSGSPFTSIVDTLANWLALRLVGAHLPKFRAPKGSLSVYGDDTLLGLPGDVSESDLQEFIFFITQRIGFKVERDDLYVKQTTEYNPAFAPSIIGYAFIGGCIIGRTPAKWMEIWRVPPKPVKTAVARYALWNYMGTSPPGDPLVFWWRQRYCCMQQGKASLWHNGPGPAVKPALEGSFLHYAAPRCSTPRTLYHLPGTHYRSPLPETAQLRFTGKLKLKMCFQNKGMLVSDAALIAMQMACNTARPSWQQAAERGTAVAVKKALESFLACSARFGAANPKRPGTKA